MEKLTRLDPFSSFNVEILAITPNVYVLDSLRVLSSQRSTICDYWTWDMESHRCKEVSQRTEPRVNVRNSPIFSTMVLATEGVPDRHYPATWKLDVTIVSRKSKMSFDFAQTFDN
ncbi:hypothetical protein YC2023_107425 [Brassica napus]